VHLDGRVVLPVEHDETLQLLDLQDHRKSDLSCDPDDGDRVQAVLLLWQWYLPVLRRREFLRWKLRLGYYLSERSLDCGEVYSVLDDTTSGTRK